jgi:hypothetical protein
MRNVLNILPPFEIPNTYLELQRLAPAN